MIKADRFLPSKAVSSWLNYSSSAIITVQEFAPVWSWDFTTQGNSGWTTSTYTSSGGGGPSATWQGTYYDLWSGTDGVNLNYSSATATRNVTITSSEQLVIYIDAQISQTAYQGLGLGQTIVTQEGRQYPNLSRRAIRLGVSDATVNATAMRLEAISLWGNGGALITQGRVYWYGIYVAKRSQQTQMEAFLTAKGLTIY